MFERLHLEDRRRKEKETELALSSRSKDLEECTFAPSVSARETAPTERDALPVHERLLQDAARHKEKMLQLEAAQVKLHMEQAPFSPLIPESSRRLANESEATNIFERLAQRKSIVKESEVPSRHGSISERSLYRPKSTGRERSSSTSSGVVDEPSVLTKKPLTPEEQEALYGRLTERAKSAAEKLRELRNDPDAGRESTVSPQGASKLGGFSDRSLSRSRSRSAADADKPSVLTKAPLTPEEQEALYNRLNERAKTAAEKLRELREHPEVIAETAAAAIKSSSYASFEDRSLFRSKSVGRTPNVVHRVASNTEPRPLSAEEQDALYARLIERAREASVKLKDVRTTVPREGASYNLEVPKAAAVHAVDPEKQMFYDRLATPKKPVESEVTYPSLPDRSLTSTREPSSATPGRGAMLKERPKSFIPVRSGSIRANHVVESGSGTKSSDNFSNDLNEPSSDSASKDEVATPVIVSETNEGSHTIKAPDSAQADVSSSHAAFFKNESSSAIDLEEPSVGADGDSFQSPEKASDEPTPQVQSSVMKPMTPFSPITELSVDVENTPQDTLVVSDAGEVNLSPRSAVLKAGLKSTPGGVFY